VLYVASISSLMPHHQRFLITILELVPQKTKKEFSNRVNISIETTKGQTDMNPHNQLWAMALTSSFWVKKKIVNELGSSPVIAIHWISFPLLDSLEVSMCRVKLYYFIIFLNRIKSDLIQVKKSWSIPNPTGHGSTQPDPYIIIVYLIIY
jgi:hypothetical protein